MRAPNLKSFITSLILFLCLQFAAARVDAQEAYKIDEVKNPRCDLSEVQSLYPLSPFTTALNNNPDSRGAIVMYGMQGEVTAYARAVKDWLPNVNGTNPERLVTIYGGFSEDTRMELWIIPKGAAEPKVNYIEDIKTAQKFDLYVYWNGDYNYCHEGRIPSLANFADTLKQRSGWQGYIIIHPHMDRRLKAGDAGWDPDGQLSRQQALHRVAKDKTYLIRKYGVASTRIKGVVGENDKWTYAELWLVPPGAEPPLAAAKSSIK